MIRIYAPVPQGAGVVLPPHVTLGNNVDIERLLGEIGLICFLFALTGFLLYGSYYTLQFLAQYLD